jgi:hypothetical protein
MTPHMELLAAWVWFPLVFVAACGGWGLLVERATGHPLSGVLLAPLGYATIVVVSQLVTLTDATAELTLPVVVAGAMAGLWAGRRRIALDRLPVAAALVVFAVLGAPVFLSGEATFAGYAILGDTAIHFLGVDHLMTRGQEVSGLAPSTYAESVRAYYDAAGYPSGAHTALGALRPVSGLDVAWVFQPYLAVLGALTSLTLWALCDTLRARERAIAATLGALPALYVGYHLIGSVKEVAAALVIALLAALVGQLRDGLRTVLPLAIAAGAGLGVLSLALAPWLGLVLLAAAAVVVRRRGLRALPGPAIAFLAATLVLGIPALLELGRFVDVVGVVTSAQVELGNLFGPLKVWQALPVWPAGDFRFPPESELAVIASGLVALAGLVRLRAPLVWLYLGVSLVATLYVVRRGSPWADAKALMILSPAIATAAAAGALSWRPRVGYVLAAVLAAGVLWSAALAYHDVSLAPRDRLTELQDLDVEGPVLTTEFEEFAKHFLRDADPVAPLEPYQSAPVGFSAVPRPGYGNAIDLTHLDPAYVRSFRTLVLRRSPLTPRPVGFQPAGGTKHYAVWTRGTGGSEPCAADPVTVPLDRAQLPPYWGPSGAGEIGVHGAGTLTATFEAGGDLQVWLGGSIGREVTVEIDGRSVGKVAGARNYGGALEPVGFVTLRPGAHELRISRPRGDLSPGDGSGTRLGPVVLASAGYRCAS